MTPSSPILDEAEGLVCQLAEELVRPRERECLCCYVARMLAEYSCDGTHRHAFRFQQARAPRATGFAARLGRLGACCCDCELFLNGYQLPSSPYESLYDDGVDDDGVDDDGVDADGADADPGGVGALPDCAGVRRGSLQPCGAWMRIRRY
jgi:hypothetical protein